MIEYVKLNHIKEGDVVSKSVYLIDGRLLIGKGRPVTSKIIKSLYDLGYRGLYIENRSSLRREIIPVQEPLISDEDVIDIAVILSKMFKFSKCFENPYDVIFKDSMKKLEEKVSTLCQSLYRLEAGDKLFYEIDDIRNKNDWFYYHLINTCILSVSIAIKHGNISKPDLELFALGSLIHDLGKADLPFDLIDKTELSDDERILLRKHPAKMFRLLQYLRYGIPMTYGIWQHHEYADGSGYPNGLRSDNITIWGKILSIANVFDNLTHYIPYRKEILTPDEALEKLCGDTKFDSDIVKLLIKTVAAYQVGSKVLLSNGDEALILKNNPQLPMRPIVLAGSEVYDMASHLRDVVVLKVVE